MREKKESSPALKPLPEIMCGLAAYPPGFTASKFHAGKHFWSINYTISGTAHEILAHGEAWTQPHDVTILKPGGIHRWEVPRDSHEPWQVVWFIFVPMPQWLPLLALPEEFPHFCHISLAGRKYDSKIRRTLIQAHWLANSPQGHHALVMNTLERALLWLQMELSATYTQLDQRVQATMEFFLRRLANPPSIPEAAAACGLSPSRLTGLFHASTGLTPQEWFEKARLSHTRDLLLSTGLPIKLIAAAVGYNDQRHYATRFRKLFGIPPSVYREQESVGSGSHPQAATVLQC
jgi:AraC family transcriptional regulator of arabinose operon